MIITYSGKSAISAKKIAEAGDFDLVRGSSGDANWGRNQANTSLNPDIFNSTNKYTMRCLFKDNDVPMPELVAQDDVHEYLAEGSWIVGRPDRHTKGRGFWLIKTEEDFARALRGTRRKQAATHFMEYIDAPHELRVHIFLGKSIRISEKKFSAPGTYTTIKPTVAVKQARKAAKKAVRALGLDFGAVDILVQEDGTPYVLEVNAAPGLGGTTPKLYADAFRKWYEDEA